MLAGSRDRMLRHRADFLAACGWGSADGLYEDLATRDAILLNALRESRPVVLWFEHDLYDQLQLLDVLALAGDVGFEDGALELVESGVHLGPLSADELDALLPSRRVVTDADTVAAQAGWDAVRAPDPRALLALALDPPASRPFLGAAALRFLEELPAVGSGLSRTERQLLALLADGPMLTGALFVASQSLEEAPFHGDAWIFRTLELLVPLVALEEGLAAITDDGRAVLAGEQDRVAFGSDRWLGGTRLAGEAVWRWDGAARALVPPR